MPTLALGNIVIVVVLPNDVVVASIVWGFAGEGGVEMGGGGMNIVVPFHF